VILQRLHKRGEDNKKPDAQDDGVGRSAEEDTAATGLILAPAAVLFEYIMARVSRKYFTRIEPELGQTVPTYTRENIVTLGFPPPYTRVPTHEIFASSSLTRTHLRRHSSLSYRVNNVSFYTKKNKI